MGLRKLLLSLLLITILAEVAAQDLETIGQQKPFTISGGASARTIFYSANGIENRRKPFSYVVTGSPVISVYGVTIPLYFVFSEQERSFRQPFNQFGLSPRYKWITLHAGYRNLNYSQYTLGGHTMLGAGVELNPGIFRFGFMYGRLNRATAVDTTSGSFDPFRYTRRGYAAKVGIGKGNNFIDLSFIKAKDDSTSAQNVEGIVPRVTPAENFVFGLTGGFTYQNFFIEADAGLSLYTNNLGSSVPFDSIPKALKNTLGKFISVNGSTEFYSAYNIGVGYRFEDITLRIQYRRIDPDFKSMGAYFFNNDLENITIAPTFSLFKRKLHFSGSLGIQRDNLQKQKESTSRRVIGSANVSATLSERLGVDLTYTNFSTRQKPGRVLVADTLLVTQSTGSMGITPRYIIPKENITHTFLLSWNFTNLVDLNKSTEANSELTSTMVFLNYQIMLVPQNLSLYINFNSMKLDMSTGTTSNKGVTLGGNKNLKDNKFNVGLSVSVMQSKTGGRKGTILNNGLQCIYRVNDHHSFNTNINYIGSSAANVNPEGSKFSELRGEIAYTVSF
jgi:hypothetical protein